MTVKLHLLILTVVFAEREQWRVVVLHAGAGILLVAHLLAVHGHQEEGNIHFNISTLFFFFFGSSTICPALLLTTKMVVKQTKSEE